MIKELFRIGRRGKEYTLGGTWLQPSHNGFWEQDAFAIYIDKHGSGSFATVPHRTIQSFVRGGLDPVWQQGDFAAHFTGMRKKTTLLKTVEEFIKKHVTPKSEDVECGGSEDGFDYRGSDLRVFKPAESAAVCCAACTADIRCRSWTWVKDPKHRFAQFCFLKWDSPDKVPDASCVAGWPNRPITD